MTKSQENKSTRNYNVIDVANEYPLVWENLPAFKTGMESFISINAAIDSQAAIQKQNITGIAIDKELKKEQLVKLMLIVSGEHRLMQGRKKTTNCIRKCLLRIRN
ncbi:MAG: hypothetical protein IPJ79_11020 [Bacteroidetes bacterium]|nr:hypothetical protein [Bacteroidota bacterium]